MGYFPSDGGGKVNIWKAACCGPGLQPIVVIAVVINEENIYIQLGFTYNTHM
jgi:hypothetical protein